MPAAVAALQHPHCLNHPRREAAAQCTSCKQPFCRECVTELDGRMVCGACHRAKVEAKAKSKRDWFLVTASLQALLGLVLLWGTAWFFGKLLLSTPSAFHEGAMWQRFGF
jgi:hypothetical protein